MNFGKCNAYIQKNKVMKETLNNELIKAVRDKLLDDISVAGYLMETLSIGKEAVYRRLRGDVPFSFNEVIQIAKALGLSLDEIAGNSSSSHGAIFTLSLPESSSLWDYFYTIFRRYRDLYVYLKGDPTAKISVATNVIPFVFHSKHETLTKFRLSRWLHQKQVLQAGVTMKDIQVPENIVSILQEITELLPQIAESYSIWDYSIFNSLIQEIRYFYELNFITPEELSVMKEELMILLDEFEKMAYTGVHENGNKVFIYISNINFDASYGFMEKKDFQISLLHLYTIDHIDSQHPEVCREQKNWIQSLKRYSTLITHCGEAQRTAFFRKQREIVTEL